MIKIVIVDDHHLVRQGLRALLDREAGFSVVGEAGDGEQALRTVREHKPDVLVLDVAMPGKSGLDLIPLVKQVHPPIRVLMLSMHDNECYVMHALHQGADGYLLKDTTGPDLVLGIRTVMAGKRYLSPLLAGSVLDALLDAGGGGGAVAYKLTKREEDVLRFTVDGLSSTTIAERLAISPRTVEAHRTSVMRKLGVHSKAELIRHVLEHGSMLPKGRKIPSKTARQ